MINFYYTFLLTPQQAPSTVLFSFVIFAFSAFSPFSIFTQESPRVRMLIENEIRDDA